LPLYERDKMVVVNTQGQEINAKIVYYGPALSGKTTNLEQIYERMPSDAKGKMVSMKTRTDRTLFFDFLPIELGDINGYRTRMLLYTVPGQVYYNATRKLVLKGADAVVFVADSSPSKLAENIESLRNLEENLNELGLTLDTIPWVIQYNKRDLPDAAPVRTLETELNLLRVPSFEAIAKQGLGVYETFQGVAGVLYTRLAGRLVPPGRPAAQKPVEARPTVRPVESERAREASVSQVIEVGLREVGHAEGQPTGVPRVPGGETIRPAVGARAPQPDSKRFVTPQSPPKDAGGGTFRFASLEAAPIDENVGRVIDLEADSGEGAERGQIHHPEREFITDPCRASEQDDGDDISSSISALDGVSLGEPAAQTDEECVITVPVLLSKSQTRKTIPIKLRLEVHVVDDDM
jgi:signal recognition particle receptor subunit beta